MMARMTLTINNKHKNNTGNQKTMTVVATDSHRITIIVRYVSKNEQLNNKLWTITTIIGHNYHNNHIQS